MKIFFILLSLISILSAAPFDNIFTYHNNYENDFNDTTNQDLELTSPQPTEGNGNLNRWIVLLAPRIIEDEPSEINTITDNSANTNKTENEPYTIFESFMDPANPENYNDFEDFSPLRNILSSLFSFNPWSLKANEDTENEEVASTEPTPSLKVLKGKDDELPESLALPTPPTVETDNTTESITQIEIENSLIEDLNRLENVEKLVRNLEEKERVEFIFDDDDTDLEFYKQQLDLLKSMENTLQKLKTYFEENGTQAKLLEQSWSNSIIIASVGIIYLILIFAFISFKSLFETQKEQKDDGLLDVSITTTSTAPIFSIEKSSIQHV